MMEMGSQIIANLWHATEKSEELGSSLFSVELSVLFPSRRGARH
jgi:hypothetical protein